MDLTQASAAFDHLPVVDVATGLLIGRCQMDLFDDSKREGLSSSRRVVSMTPDVAGRVPAHSKVQIDGQLWLLTSPHHDYWFTQRIRTKFVALNMATTLRIATAANLLASQPGREVPCELVWNKNDRREAVGDGSYPVYTAYFSQVDNPDVTEYAVMGTDYFRVRAAYVSPSGAHAAELVPLPYGGVKAVQYQGKASKFDPVQGKHVAPAAAAKPALVADWFDVYRITAVGQEGKRGDLSVVMAADNQAPGDTLDIDGQAYRVIFVQERDGVAMLRVRV
jgi:hypothetical protein